MPESSAVRIQDLAAHAGAQVLVQGWLYNRRSSKSIHFLQLRDGTGIVQAIVARADLGDEIFERAGAIGQEASLRVTGEVRLDPRAPGGVELHVSGVEEIGPASGYPLSKQAHGPDFLLSRRHLWLRSRRPSATLRVRDTIIKAIHDHLHREGFVQVDAPVFTPSACEGTTSLFEVDYFGEQKAYLSQSGQLYMEAAAMALGKVYCFGPTFRAERSKTRRHLTEFWMMEPEIAFASLDDVMELIEALVVFIVQRVLETNRCDLETLERDIAALEQITAPFPPMTYDEAAAQLAQRTDFTAGADFGAPDEEALTKDLKQPLLVHRWPKQIKAFYMRRDPEDERYVLGVDLLAPEGFGELVGGGERSIDLEQLEAEIDARGLDREAFEWYLDLRRYGSVPHAGFGLGLERTVAWICGLPHIREAIPFPRTLYRLRP